MKNKELNFRYTNYFDLDGSRQAKTGIRTRAKCADTDHPAHAQSITRTFVLHSYILNGSDNHDLTARNRRPVLPSLSAYTQRHVFYGAVHNNYYYFIIIIFFLHIVNVTYEQMLNIISFE